MITLKNKAEVITMREAGRISAAALALGGRLVKPGVTTAHINAEIEKYIRSQNAIPSFLGYGGFPASACISVNEEVIHGIPGERILHEGDIVSIDVGAVYNGFHGDNAATFAVGKVSPEKQKLMDVTKESLMRGIEQAQAGNRIGDISNAVESYAESFGCGVVREFVGHGVGRELHESPEVPNYGRPGRGARLQPGMTIAIEPMINLAGEAVKVLDDEWTVVTLDSSPSAHFEHTVLITEKGPVILTCE